MRDMGRDPPGIPFRLTKRWGRAQPALGPERTSRSSYLPLGSFPPWGSLPPRLWGWVGDSGVALSPASPAGFAVSAGGAVVVPLSPAFMPIPAPVPMLALVPDDLPAGFDASAFFAAAALAVNAAFGMIRTDLIVVHSSGLLFSFGIPGLGPVGELAILSSTSIPAIRCPNAVYFPSRPAFAPCMMKNCEPPEFGAPVCAIESTPFTCRCELNSSLMLYPGPPVPRSGAFGFLELGSPPWIMKPFMMR